MSERKDDRKDDVATHHRVCLSAGAQWQPACVEPEGPSKRLRKTVTLSDLTLCLDEQEKGSSRVAPV